jgi:hypothetical protein
MNNYMYLIFIELRKKIVFTFSFVRCYFIAKQLYINAALPSPWIGILEPQLHQDLQVLDTSVSSYPVP